MSVAYQGLNECVIYDFETLSVDDVIMVTIVSTPQVCIENCELCE